MKSPATWGNGRTRRNIGVFLPLPELYLLIISQLKVEDVGAILSHDEDVATHYDLDVLNNKFLPRHLKMRDARPDCIEFEQGLTAIGTVKKFIPPVKVDEL